MTDTTPAEIIASWCGGLNSSQRDKDWIAGQVIEALSDAGYVIFPTKTANSLADFVLEFAKDKRLQKTAYEVSGKIIVDKEPSADRLKAGREALRQYVMQTDQALHCYYAMTQPKDTGS